jgi:hypothetical protein
MLKKTVSRTYIYNAHGHALSGHITRPFDQLIEVQAGMSLPTTGGIGQARVENFRFREYVSFSAGYTYVAGSHDDNGIYTTLVTSVVEDLNILDVVTADRVVARLTSHHNLNDQLNQDEPQITLLGSKIENLEISGCPVRLEFDNDVLVRLNTFEALKKRFDDDTGFRKMAADPFVTTKPNVPIDRCGVFLCSLVKDMNINCPGVTTAGHAFEVPEFGRVYIGEVLAQYRKRTLTMLRVQLGCSVGGCVTTTEVIGNGHHLP